MKPVSKKQGARIANLINEMMVAQTIIRGALEKTPYDAEKVLRWRGNYDRAVAELRHMQIPVVA